VAKQGQVRDLARRHLDEVHAELEQHVEARGIERRRKESDASLPAVVRENLVSFPGKLELPDHLELALARVG
jgi:hypothetical protein